MRRRRKLSRAADETCTSVLHPLPADAQPQYAAIEPQPEPFLKIPADERHPVAAIEPQRTPILAPEPELEATGTEDAGDCAIHRDEIAAVRARARAIPNRDASMTITRRNKFSPELMVDAQRYFGKRLKRPVRDDEARNYLGDIVDYFMLFVK